MKVVACPHCGRQWDVSRHRVGERLRCECASVIEVPRLRSFAPDVHHCQACGASRPPGGAACAYCGAVPALDAASLTLVCPVCFRRTPGGSKFCCSCGTAITPARLGPRSTALACPRCVGPTLVHRPVGSFAAAECPGCSGLWVGATTFEDLVQRRAARAGTARRTVADGRQRSTLDSSQTTVVYLKCPVCKTHMHRWNYRRVSGVLIDECRAHGVWLDRDELGRIADHVSTRGGGTRRAVPATPRARSPRAVPPSAKRLPTSRPPSGGPAPTRDRTVLDTILRLVQEMVR